MTFTFTRLHERAVDTQVRVHVDITQYGTIRSQELNKSTTIYNHILIARVINSNIHYNYVTSCYKLLMKVSTIFLNTSMSTKILLQNFRYLYLSCLNP